MGEPPINRSLERRLESDVGGISLVVRIWGTVVALARRVQGRSLRMLIDLGLTGNYLSAQCQTALELEVRSKEDFEWLTLVDSSELHVQGYVQFFLHCGNYKTKIFARLFPNLHEELILRIP